MVCAEDSKKKKKARCRGKIKASKKGGGILLFGGKGVGKMEKGDGFWSLIEIQRRIRLGALRGRKKGTLVF